MNAPHRRRMHRARSGQTGVALIEALIGILIFSIGILGLLGLQAASIRNTTEAKYRNEASYLANQIVGRMWGDVANLPTYDTTSGSNVNMTSWRTNVASTLPGVTVGGTNTPTITVAGNQVTVTVRWKLPGTDSIDRRFTVVAQINAS